MPSAHIFTGTAVGSVEEFLATVRGIRDKWAAENKFWKPWFRGQACESWDLKPRLYRAEKELQEVLSDEEEFRYEFQRKGLQLVSDQPIPKSDFEWYFLMQHYGAPTRLLDWTDGALMGLFFAVEHRFSKLNPDRKKDAAVWMLDPDWLNEKTTTKKDDIEGVALPEWPVAQEYLPQKFEDKMLRRKYPLAIDPTHVARRLAVQKSRFTIHGTIFNGLEKVASKGRKPRLVKIMIRRDKVKPIRKDLELCGISVTTLFPDLENLGLELQRLWKGGSEL